MRLPAPRPSLVIRYAFLWTHEKLSGAIEAARDRPSVVVVAVRKEGSDDIRVTVAPITHEPPSDARASITIPSAIARSVGLDDRQQWLRLDEPNRFTWPGYDLPELCSRHT